MTQHPGRSDPIVETLIAEELSASESYRQALDRVSEDAGRGDIRRLENEHRQAACMLRERFRGSAPSAAGPWGGWSRAIEACAPEGGEAAIRALIAGEERGIEEYERALECPRLDPDLKRLISTTLLPQTRAHLPVLDRFLRTTRRL